MCHPLKIVDSGAPVVVLSPFRGEKVAHAAGIISCEAAGTFFLIVLVEEKIMLGAFTLVLKNLIKCSLDNYILPGTLTGTEILWLYMVQWKRDLTVLASASYSLFISQCELPKLERVISQDKSGSRSAN